MKPLISRLVQLALVLVALLLIVVLGLRYWLLPQVNQWRAPLEQMLSEASGSEIRIGALAVDWHGWQPRLQMDEVRILRSAEQQLVIPKLTAALQFGLKTLRFDAVASLQEGSEQSVRIKGDFQIQPLVQHQQWEGVLYGQFNQLDPQAWRDWVELPTNLQQATLDAQFWLRIEQSEVEHLTMDTRVYNGLWQLDDHSQLRAQSLRVFTAAPWQEFRAFADEVPLAQRLQAGLFHLEVVGQDLHLENSDLFAQDWGLDEFVLIAERAEPQAGQPIRIRHLAASNADTQAHFSGSWTPQGTDLSLGHFDMQGQLLAAQINQIYKYLPMPEVSPEVVQWLEGALVKGVVPQAAVRLQGNWHDFPYEGGQGGMFFIGGAFEGAEVDYYQPDPGELGWPKAEQAQGYLQLHNEGLWVRDAQAVLRPNGKDPVQAKQLSVHIDDLDADEPILTIDGQTTGAAQAYLGLMRHSDLGELLSHAFEHSQASGQWQVPLHLRINIEDEDDIAVQGQIHFANNTVQLLPFLPPFEQVKGRLLFNEKGALAEDLEAQWLGGQVHIADTVGQAGQMLRLEGQAQLASLTHYLDMEALEQYLSGSFNYEVKAGFDAADRFQVTGFTDLQGVQSLLPAPLTKEEQVAMPLHFDWHYYDEPRYQLGVRLQDKLQLQLIENTDMAEEAALFTHGSLAWQQPLPALPDKGFAVDIAQNELSLDAWWEVMEQLTADEKEPTAEGAGGWQELVWLRLKSNKVMLFDNDIEQLTYTLQQNNARQWRSDISSKPIAGTVQWQQDASGKVVGAVQTKLQRLHWGSWRLGALQLEAQPVDGADAQWAISHLSLSTPYGELLADGALQQKGAQRGLNLRAQLQSEEVGELLRYVGINDVLAEGEGVVHAELQWLDFPWSTELKNLHASIDLDLYEGRIDKINSRAAKMLEVLSLQSLSRLSRLDLDVRGLFKDGFPFDDIKGRLELDQQVLSTKNFRVVGPAGTIVIEGDTQLDTETLDLQAVVVPNVDMSGAAIAAGIALNPVVGIGAFVTQLLFKDPLANAMTVRYELQGHWDQFELEEVKLKAQ